MALRFRVSSSAAALALTLVSSAADVVALAQTNPTAPNQSAAALHSAQSINTPEKKQRWLRDKYHVVLSQKWPVNFPVPVYESNLIQTTFSNSTQGQPVATASLITKDPPARVFDFYQNALSRAKWTVRVPSAKARSEMNISADYYFLMADQGKQTINVTCAANSKTGTTLVSVTWEKHL